MNRDPLPAAAPCPCGSGQPFAACCGPLLDGRRAATAEALMRSRYCAYVLHDDAYLLATWDPASRPMTDAPSHEPGLVWAGLQVLQVEDGGEGDMTGTVDFVARYRQQERPGQLHEISRFRRVDGRWFYVEGEQGLQEPPARNAPCPCGSGKKYKRCCAG